MLINVKGQLLDLSQPKVMGILNLTPDSFYDGGNYLGAEHFLFQTEKMLNEGAMFIDVGAFSSRPNGTWISEEEEWQRLEKPLELLLQKFPELILSIDTFRSKIAHQAIDYGVSMVNDISAGHLDEAMLPLIAQIQVPYIMMHMRGTPQTMSQLTDYDNLIKEVLCYFSERIHYARTLGINDLIIDPGFGFAKTLEQNFTLLRELEHFQSLQVPILVGVSRKSMIYKTLESSAAEALNGTTALNMVALTKGASILRVHDVKEAMECVKLFESLMK